MKSVRRSRSWSRSSRSQIRRIIDQRIRKYRPLFQTAPAPHFLFREWMHRPRWFRLGHRLEDRLGQVDVSPRGDLDVARGAFDQVDFVAGGFHELGVVGNAFT